MNDKERRERGRRVMKDTKFNRRKLNFLAVKVPRQCLLVRLVNVG
jgi:hypothetical protein